MARIRRQNTSRVSCWDGPGAVLEVIETDPQSPADFEVLCAVGGHILVAASAADGIHRFEIKPG